MKQAIVVIGGYNSAWLQYLNMARHLEDLSGLQAVGVPLMPWHWWAATKKEEASELLQKLEETVAWARRKLAADRLVLVGHSAGGLIARLYLHEKPVWGRVYAGLEHVSRLITLGSPHCQDKGASTHWYLSDMANKLAPGTPHADHIQYTAVVGRYLLGREKGDRRERRAFHAYRYFTGEGAVWGDGIVPVAAARLDGTETRVLEGVAHSRKYSRNWYGGSKQVIRSWWKPGDLDAH
jgi:pimeloyl-ACP methyl ester carboxylesterase